MKTVGLLIRLARPLFLLGGILLYALGLGIAHYLGATLDWPLVLLGQGWVTVLQLSAHFFNEYYNAAADNDNPNRTPFSGGSGMLAPGKLPRRTALLAGLTCLTVLASLTVLLIVEKPAPLVFVLMVLAFLGAFFYSAPPLALESSGYGELVTSFLVSFLVPAFAFTLQAHELHRLVAMSTFPLAALHMAMLMTFELPDYATDIRHDKHTLLVRMGWQNGMRMHNIMILTAYLLLGLLMVIENGLGWFVALPALLTMPLALLQIWQMQRIAGGARPNWTAVALGGLSLFGVMAYLITFAYWTH